MCIKSCLMVLILLINEVLLCKYCFKFKICFYLSLKISSSSYFRTQETGSHYQVRDRKLFQLNVHRWKRILLVFQLREKKVVINMYILRLIHPSDLKLMLHEDCFLYFCRDLRSSIYDTRKLAEIFFQESAMSPKGLKFIL